MTETGVSTSCSPEVAIGITANDFLALELDAFPSENWTKAIDTLKTRIEKRYLNPLKDLSGMNGPDHTFGFIVLTAAFALVETLEGFRQGIEDHSGKSISLFVAGLSGLKIRADDVLRDLSGSVDSSGKATAGEKLELYSGGRCALLHSGGTDKITIRIGGDDIEKLSDGRYSINRDSFVIWLEKKFTAYLAELKEPSKDDLRIKFVAKMRYICRNA